MNFVLVDLAAKIAVCKSIPDGLLFVIWQQLNEGPKGSKLKFALARAIGICAMPRGLPGRV